MIIDHLQEAARCDVFLVQGLILIELVVGMVSRWSRLAESRLSLLISPIRFHHFLPFFRGHIKKEKEIMVEVNRMSEWGGRVVVRVYISDRLSSLFRHALAFSQLSPLLESKKYACLNCCPSCISPVVDEPLLCFRDMEWYNFNIGTFSLLCMQLCKTCSESAVQVTCAELPTPNRLEFQNSNSLFLAQIQSLESLN